MRAAEQLVPSELSCEAAEEEELPSRDDKDQEDVHVSEDVDEEVHVAEDVSEDESFAHMAGKGVEHESPVPLSVREKIHTCWCRESSMLTPPHSESTSVPEVTPTDVRDTPPVVTRRPSRPTRQAAVCQRRMLQELLEEDLV